MKNRILICIMALAVPIILGQSKVPNIKLKKLNGKSVMLQDYLKSGPVLINFWATWCAPCKKEMVYLDQFEKKYTKNGFSILAVSTDSQKSLSQVRSYIRSKKYTFEVFQDPNSQIFKKLNGNLMPTNILISKEGQILWQHYGYLPGDETQLEKEIRSALKIDS
ncbi:MAG: TlpA family protein disulfide reductase [Candidatus Marinimicrobia bacterium]|jgi:thiol-disulfide isomerase/thioredoxin|nr:TlpA family protein disulfide reductase [Candidatus Neomarinimicrobiota bacterium]MBT3675873.1 TlpA family protein disulfide reductase [Candidatus Neomarinimicrobiota bacterium]MBT3763478.1 TlpA family protein disulfide reductase [Candidatus Neomarinimicrobiota bacterium]MBT4068566.1 TlpA family protein disulfide reductase [Candidatus Neomarinimicrobiota bacterium]MBT4271568.1 TlpA family protein disulfide reductase [Candidatus Neomarinimicrobiota bacterium]